MLMRGTYRFTVLNVSGRGCKRGISEPEFDWLNRVPKHVDCSTASAGPAIAVTLGAGAFNAYHWFSAVQAKSPVEVFVSGGYFMSGHDLSPALE